MKGWSPDIPPVGEAIRVTGTVRRIGGEQCHGFYGHGTSLRYALRPIDPARVSTTSRVPRRHARIDADSPALSHLLQSQYVLAENLTLNFAGTTVD